MDPRDNADRSDFESWRQENYPGMDIEKASKIYRNIGYGERGNRGSRKPTTANGIALPGMGFDPNSYYSR